MTEERLHGRKAARPSCTYRQGALSSYMQIQMAGYGATLPLHPRKATEDTGYGAA